MEIPNKGGYFFIIQSRSIDIAVFVSRLGRAKGLDTADQDFL